MINLLFLSAGFNCILISVMQGITTFFNTKLFTKIYSINKFLPNFKASNNAADFFSPENYNDS